MLRRNGKTVGLADCSIAVVARVNKARALTLDKHFEVLKEMAAVDLLPRDAAGNHIGVDRPCRRRNNEP